MANRYFLHRLPKRDPTNLTQSQTKSRKNKHFNPYCLNNLKKSLRWNKLSPLTSTSPPLILTRLPSSDHKSRHHRCLLQTKRVKRASWKSGCLMQIISKLKLGSPPRRLWFAIPSGRIITIKWLRKSSGSISSLHLDKRRVQSLRKSNNWPNPKPSRRHSKLWSKVRKALAPTIKLICSKATSPKRHILSNAHWRKSRMWLCLWT